MQFKPMNPIQWSPTVEDLEHLKKTKPDNRQFVSNQTDFMMEMFKMMPAAEVHGFMKGLESSRAGFSVESFRDLRGDFAPFPPDPPLSDPPPDYIEDIWDADYEVLLNSLTNVGVLECVTSNSYKLKQTYCDQVKNGNFALPSGIDDHFDEKVLGKIAKILIDAQLKAKYTEEFGKLDSEFSGIKDQLKFMDARYNNDSLPASGFGAQHRQGAPMAGNAFGSPVKKFTRYNSSITEYQHTSDSRMSDVNNNKKYTYLDGREYSVEEDAIPIWSAKTATNRFIDTTSYRSDFKATDYTNLFYGTSPNLIKDRTSVNWVGTAGKESTDLPSVPDYGYDLGGGDTIFKRAKAAFSGIYTRTNNGTESTPSFYEIAMDPDAPWNGGSGGWWTGKDAPTLAFYLDVLMAESKRRYLSAMTEVFGPSSQLQGFADTKDRTNSANNIDKRMIEWTDKTIGKETDNYKYSSGYKKSVMALFLLGNHSIANWFQFFGDGQGLYDSPENIGNGMVWTSKADNERIPNFLRWLNVNVEKYKTDYLPSLVSGISTDGEPKEGDYAITNQIHEVLAALEAIAGGGKSTYADGPAAETSVGANQSKTISPGGKIKSATIYRRPRRSTSLTPDASWGTALSSGYSISGETLTIGPYLYDADSADYDSSSGLFSWSAGDIAGATNSIKGSYNGTGSKVNDIITNGTAFQKKFTIGSGFKGKYSTILDTTDLANSFFKVGAKANINSATATAQNRINAIPGEISAAWTAANTAAAPYLATYNSESGQANVHYIQQGEFLKQHNYHQDLADSWHRQAEAHRAKVPPETQLAYEDDIRCGDETKLAYDYDCWAADERDAGDRHTSTANTALNQYNTIMANCQTTVNNLNAELTRRQQEIADYTVLLGFFNSNVQPALDKVNGVLSTIYSTAIGYDVTIGYNSAKDVTDTAELIRQYKLASNGGSENPPMGKPEGCSYIGKSYLPTYQLYDLHANLDTYIHGTNQSTYNIDQTNGSLDLTKYFASLNNEFVGIKNGMSVMELSYELRYGIALHQLNPDGSIKTDQNGNPIDDTSYAATANYKLLPNSMEFSGSTLTGNTWEETIGNFISNDQTYHYMSVYLQRRSPSEHQTAQLNNIGTTSKGYLQEGNAYKEVWMSHALTLLANSVVPDVVAKFMITNIFNRTSQNQFEQKKKKYEDAVEEDNKEEARIEAETINRILQERKSAEAKAKSKKKAKK